jgi:alpha-L-rhamnosidase
MKSNVLCYLLSFSVLCCCNAVDHRPHVANLQCEYMIEPLGVVSQHPRFSWQLIDPQHSRGQQQTAFQLLVATDPALLTEQRADVWNSDILHSQQSVLVPFDGAQLQSSKAYFWKVRIWDKDGLPTDWSPAARFVTGLLDSAEWSAAQWIHHPNAPSTQHVWFRKNIDLKKNCKNVFAYVASLGYHELYVNGKKVDSRVLAPTLSDLQKRLCYVIYDISPFLKQGKNTVALWFAAGWTAYHCFALEPCLKVIVAGDGLNIASDNTWRTLVSNSGDTERVRSFDHNGGEIVDARMANPVWNLPEIDDSVWPMAEVVECAVPLEPQMVEPSRIIDTIRAQSVSDAGNGIWKVDFGKNFTGWISARFHGLQAGDTVEIGSADDVVAVCDFNVRNFFVSAGRDGEEFSNRFNYLTGRYANFTGLRQRPSPDDFTAFAVSTDLRRTGSFCSSNSLYNKIYETDVWTFLSNTTEGYTSDCPHRERCGYGEVATACSWGIGLTQFDAGAFYRKIVGDWRDVQTDDGWGRHTAPQPHDGHWGGAMWSSAGLNVARHHYLHYGDSSIAELIYPTARRWLEFLNSNTVDGLLVQYRRHNNGQFLGDWLAPGSRNEFGTSEEAKYFNNCVYAMNLSNFIDFARLLGKTDDVALYSARLEALRPLIHKTFYHADSAFYCTDTQVQNAFALLAGITPDDERARVETRLMADMQGAHPYFDMGSSGLTVLLKYLVAHPQFGETAARILNRTEYPGYGYFIENGETTWPEDWKIDVPSKIHTCYTGITGWLVKSLCGIQPDPAMPGYRRFLVQPIFASTTDFAEATVESPYGQIRCRWERHGDTVALIVVVPPGSRAKICFPEGCKNVFANKNDNNLLSENGEKLLISEVESGEYRFSVKYNGNKTL